MILRLQQLHCYTAILKFPITVKLYHPSKTIIRPSRGLRYNPSHPDPEPNDLDIAGLLICNVDVRISKTLPGWSR